MPQMNSEHIKTILLEQVQVACRHLLSQQDSNPYSPNYGCFDRRYWGWKLVDYAEATFQRNVYPLAWLLKQNFNDSLPPTLLIERIKGGLLNSVKLQHKNGSYDQAFPYEQSYGAVAFLIHPLLMSYQIIKEYLILDEQDIIENSLRQAGDFLLRYDETHAHIANHLAGSALSLTVLGDYWNDSYYHKGADDVIERILKHQSSEGWFLEYEGADPSYQTLCMYYLAQIYHLHPTKQLKSALEKSLDFLSYFVHPDGTFAGEYGSRRTSIYYAGGIALLGNNFPQANAISEAMLGSIVNGTTTTIADIDIGNFAPILSNYVLALDALSSPFSNEKDALPHKKKLAKDFIEAGIFIRSTDNHYIIVGASNGGVVKIFDKTTQRCILDDGGYQGETKSHGRITTQITTLPADVSIDNKTVSISTKFYAMQAEPPSPFQLWVLRGLNLTVMRQITIGNRVKRLLAFLLINAKKPVPLELQREVIFEDNTVTVRDTVSLTGQLNLRWLGYGEGFVGIHMASANYYEGQTYSDTRQDIDIQDLIQKKTITHERNYH